MNCFISYLVNDRDVPGVLVQNYSLKHKFRVNTDYFCIVTKDVSEHARHSLIQDGLKLLYVDIDDLYEKICLDNSKIEILNSQKYRCYMIKFYVFMVIPERYTRCMYIDADTLFIKDPSIGFSIPTDSSIHMVRDQLINQYTVPGQPSSYRLKICENMFNSGCIVFKNTKYVWNKFISFITSCSCTFLNDGYGDQYIFNEMHKIKSIHIKNLDEIYNVIPCIYKCFASCGFMKHDDIIMIHYTLELKPWQGWYARNLYNEESKQLWMRWQHVYIEYLNHINNINPVEISYNQRGSCMDEFRRYIEADI